MSFTYRRVKVGVLTVRGEDDPIIIEVEFQSSAYYLLSLSHLEGTYIGNTALLHQHTHTLHTHTHTHTTHTHTDTHGHTQTHQMHTPNAHKQDQYTHTIVGRFLYMPIYGHIWSCKCFC